MSTKNVASNSQAVNPHLRMVRQYGEHYLKRGWAILPTHPIAPIAFGITREEAHLRQLSAYQTGKAPWGKRFSAASPITSPDDWKRTIGEAIREGADIGVGIQMGASNLFVLDIDGLDGEISGKNSLLALLESIGYDVEGEFESLLLSLTPIVIRTGNGYHLYFKAPSDVSSWKSTANFAPDDFPYLDARCNNAYVLAPPSHHYTGVDYKLLQTHTSDGEPLPKMPPSMPRELEEAIRPYLAAKGKRKVRKHDVKESSNKTDEEPTGSLLPFQLPPEREAEFTNEHGMRILAQRANHYVQLAVEGDRNDRLNRLAYSIAPYVKGGDIAYDDAVEHLLIIALGVGLPEEEAENTIISGLDSGLRQLQPTTWWTDAAIKAKAGSIDVYRPILKYHPAFQNLFAYDESGGYPYIPKARPALMGDEYSVGIADEGLLSKIGGHIHTIYGITTNLNAIRSVLKEQVREGTVPKKSMLLTTKIMPETEGVESPIGLGSWLLEHGAIETEYEASLANSWAAGSMARLLNPGCQMDYMLILYGAGGTHKTSLFEHYSLSSYTDFRFENLSTDDKRNMAQHWVRLWDESFSLKPRQVDALKSTIVLREVKYRNLYEDIEKPHPLSSVTAGTSNREEFLIPDEGNRRFLPVKIVRDIDIETFKKDLPRIHAQALLDAEKGYTKGWKVDEKALAEWQAQNESETEQQIFLRDYLGRHGANAFVKTSQIQQALRESRISRPRPGELNEIMKRLGWEKVNQHGVRGYICRGNREALTEVLNTALEEAYKAAIGAVPTKKLRHRLIELYREQNTDVANNVGDVHSLASWKRVLGYVREEMGWEQRRRNIGTVLIPPPGWEMHRIDVSIPSSDGDRPRGLVVRAPRSFDSTEGHTERETVVSTESEEQLPLFSADILRGPSSSANPTESEGDDAVVNTGLEHQVDELEPEHQVDELDSPSWPEPAPAELVNRLVREEMDSLGERRIYTPSLRKRAKSDGEYRDRVGDPGDPLTWRLTIDALQQQGFQQTPNPGGQLYYAPPSDWA